MSWSPVSSEKCCANCANWGGVRKEKLGRAEVISCGDRGKCYQNVGCVTPGPCASGGNGCSKFQKWAALK